MITLVLASLISVANGAEIPRAYHTVAERFGIPAEVFYSMILQESGKSNNGTYHPWPWTLNVDHQAYRYETRADAEHALKQFLVTHTRIAVGLGQIYLPAHKQHFSDPVILLDPAVNLHYAASLLANEYANTKKQGQPNWWVAVGRYHHPSNEWYATNYRSLVFLKCRKFSNNCLNYGKLR